MDERFGSKSGIDRIPAGVGYDGSSTAFRNRGEGTMSGYTRGSCRPCRLIVTLLAVAVVATGDKKSMEEASPWCDVCMEEASPWGDDTKPVGAVSAVKLKASRRTWGGERKKDEGSASDSDSELPPLRAWRLSQPHTKMPTVFITNWERDRAQAVLDLCPRNTWGRIRGL